MNIIFEGGAWEESGERKSGERKSRERKSGEERSASIEVGRRRSSDGDPLGLSYVSGTQLQGLQGPKIAVVDVSTIDRDDGAFDGHIAGSMHFSSGSFKEKLPKLVEEVKNKKTVVFHCSFSQVRGPTCARILNEHLNTAVDEGKLEKVPNIVVLERGFNGWAESPSALARTLFVLTPHSLKTITLRLRFC